MGNLEPINNRIGAATKNWNHLSPSPFIKLIFIHKYQTKEKTI